MPQEKHRSEGLYSKFEVRRTDGRSAPGEKHHGCRYFVLDLDHDPHAAPAIEAYAKSCAEVYPALSGDLMTWVESQRACGCRTPGECDHGTPGQLVLMKLNHRI